MDKPPPPLHTKKNELIDALKGEVRATGSSGDRGMGWDSRRVAPSNAGLGSNAPATGLSEDRGIGLGLVACRT